MLNNFFFNGIFSACTQQSVDGFVSDEGFKIGWHKEEQVGNVLIENQSDDYLLFTDMDILVGAKQNRVVNISTMVRPRSKSNLEVSCVEQHRWDRTTNGFRPSDKTMEHDLRMKKLGYPQYPVREEPEQASFAFFLIHPSTSAQLSGKSGLSRWLPV
jgi:hypothetical protein